MQTSGMQASPLAIPDEHQVMIDINTTPLIDVLLVLLVMLIITIPVQLHAVNLELPVSRPATPQAQPERVRIDIDAASQLHWQGVAIDASQLEGRLAEVARTNTLTELTLRADKDARYATFAAVLAATRRQHLNHVAVIGAEQFAP